MFPIARKEKIQWKNSIQYIEWNLNSTKFNFNSVIEFIQSKINGMQIARECIHNMLLGKNN